MFEAGVMREIASAARELGIEPAALAAVAHIESGLKTHAIIDGRTEPLIRFEGHYFDRRLSGAKREQARKAGLASPTAGAIANPASQAARWRMLARAAAIDSKAAHESVSWGIGQVMGSHWAWLDYADVMALVAVARSGVGGQIRLMARYIDKAGLRPALRERNWAAFARGYNGPGYRANRYDSKLAKAYAVYARQIFSEPKQQPAILRSGARGEAVRKMQTALISHGYSVAADGIFGPNTLAAIRKFQIGNGLVADGVVGPKTLSALESTALMLARRTPKPGGGLAAMLVWLGWRKPA